MAYPLKVWNGTSWVQVSTASTDLSSYAIIGTNTPYRISAGTETASFSASTTTNGSITFPAGRFTQAPVLTGNIVTTAAASIGAIIRFTSITSTGANYTMTVTTSTSSSVAFNWIAIQMTTGAYTQGTAQ